MRPKLCLENTTYKRFLHCLRTNNGSIKIFFLTMDIGESASRQGERNNKARLTLDIQLEYSSCLRLKLLENTSGRAHAGRPNWKIAAKKRARSRLTGHKKVTKKRLPWQMAVENMSISCDVESLSLPEKHPACVCDLRTGDGAIGRSAASGRWT